MLRVVLTFLAAVETDVLSQILIHSFVVAPLDQTRTEHLFTPCTRFDINLSLERHLVFLLRNSLTVHSRPGGQGLLCPTMKMYEQLPPSKKRQLLQKLSLKTSPLEVPRWAFRNRRHWEQYFRCEPTFSISSPHITHSRVAMSPPTSRLFFEAAAVSENVDVAVPWRQCNR